MDLDSKLHKDAGVLNFTNQSYDDSFLKLPVEILNNDVITIASWVKMPDNLDSFNDNSPLFSIEYENGYISIQREFKTTDDLVVGLPMEARLVAQKGFKTV